MDFTTAVSDADQIVHYQRSIEALEEEIRIGCITQGLDPATLADPYTAPADADGKVPGALKHIETIQARWNDIKTNLAALG